MTDDTETNQPDTTIKGRQSQKVIDYAQFGEDLRRWLSKGNTVEHLAKNLSTRPSDLKYVITTLAKGEKVSAKRGTINNIAKFCEIEIQYIDKTPTKESPRDKIHSRGNHVEAAKSPDRDVDAGRQA